MWAFLLPAIVCNLYLRKIIAFMETVGGVYHVLFFVVALGILTTMAEMG